MRATTTRPIKATKGINCQTCFTLFVGKEKHFNRVFCRKCVMPRRRERWANWASRNPEREAQIQKVNKVRRRLRNKAFVLGYLKTHPCSKCGIADVRVLQFDHISGKTKVNCVSIMVNTNKTIEAIHNEIKKCRVLCANCHMIRTTNQQKAKWKKRRPHK